ncbi:hypothetical protein [Pseudomonas sp. CGJS7]|uniref:hypothetical protein n=1 Tax=Pseudomonas sp. CGJS7 TaxID=3109348 RepID=UPI0030089CE7
MRSKPTLPLSSGLRRGAAALLTFALACASAHAATVQVEIGAQNGKVRMTPGATLVQNSLRDWGDPDALARGTALLKQLYPYKNVHLMGWGTDNPQPSPGDYRWETLDQRVAQIRAAGGTPVITLCCAPDWMRGDPAGQTDWSRFTNAPIPEHFADFAELARQVALRYPQVKHYQVWNEFKGFWNEAENRWDYEGYTRLYNLVYAALKGVNPAIKVGGPYTSVTAFNLIDVGHKSELRGPYGYVDQRVLDAIDYWLANKHGADFLTVDGGLYNTSQETVPTRASPFAMMQYYADVNRWLRNRSSLPIWWAEWYVTDTFADKPYLPGYFNDKNQNALMSKALLTMAPDVAVSLRWAPDGNAARAPGGNQESTWRDTLLEDGSGGTPFPFAASVREFRRCFAPGALLYTTRVSSADVAAYASARCVALINQTDRAQNVAVIGKQVALAAYEVRYLDR